jgi:iron complex outermembrane receptor protein
VRFLLSSVLLSVLLLGLAMADEDKAETEAPKEPPKKEERVSVTAEAEGGTSGVIGATSSVIRPGEKEGSAATVTDLVSGAPGVSENGQGGLFQVFSVRGVARQRVMSLVSGMRINSDRRAGATFTFLDPHLLDQIEVLHGPGATFHGSGALGGVVQAFPASFSDWSVQTGYDSNADENFQVVGTGGDGWSVGLARRDSGDGESADGETLNSQFTQYSGVASFRWGDGPRNYEVLYIPSYGEDIGKSNTDFPERETNYPLERHQLLQFRAASPDRWSARAYVHLYDLKTHVEETDLETRVFNDSADYGLRWEATENLSDAVSLRWGADLFGRHGVEAEERQKDLTGVEPTSRVVTLDGARELEAGAFFSARRDWQRGSLETGARLSGQEQENAGEDSDASSLDGYLGGVYRIISRLEIGASLSTGVRFPSLSERFFTGTTGRGSVLGNPDLEEERSWNVETSLQWLGSHLLVRGVVFRNEVDDYIERIEITPDVLTFRNLTSGTIEGVELHGTVIPAESWRIEFGGHTMEGRDEDDDPLSDVPPDEFFLGLRHERERWSFGTRWTHRWEKDDPGSGEKVIPSAELLSAFVSVRIADAWMLSAGGSNLLDDEYFRSADRKAPFAQGRAVSLQLGWRGGS